MNSRLHLATSPDVQDDVSVHLLDPRDPVQRRAIARLRAELPAHLVFDHLGAQLAELMEVRHPAEALSPLDLAARVRAHLDGAPPEDHGTWVHYPWSNRLVHVLPQDTFDEVRLARNRLKITAEEQARLRRLRIGIVGLSVGQASALTLAMEGVGGQFRIADFDTLSLSNMNRVRAGVHDLGVPKAVLTARALLELDPYLDVRPALDGVREDGIDAFLTADGPLDLLVEECDDLPLKLALRERARHHRIPVVMETSDRGMLDVERFDLEPDRPVLHGRLGAMRSADLRALPPEARLAAAVAIVGTEVSPRLAASAVEIGATLRSWPQLASAVALGAATVTDAARRIALGEFQASGRYHVDLDRIVCDPLPEAPVADTPAPPAEPVAPPVRAPRASGLDDDTIRDIVRHACAAPSGGNAQPWRFRWDGTRLHLDLDPTRLGTLLDFEDRAAWLACGAAVENAVLAASLQGLDADVLPPEGGPAGAVCTLRFRPRPRDAGPDPLAIEVMRRCTNRRLGARVPLPEGSAAALRSAAAARGAQLQLLDTPESMDALGAILGRGDRLRFLSRTLHGELVREIRWSPREAEATRDGIDLRTLELGSADLAALRLTATWRVMELVGGMGGGRNLEKFAQRAAAGSSAFGLVTIGGASSRHFFEGGRAVQRVWLAATRLGLGFQPLADLPYLCMRAGAGGSGLTVSETRALVALHEEYRRLLPLADGHADALLFRLARVPPPSERALRRPVETVLSL